MSFVDAKYIGLVSVRLQKFSKKKEGLYTFRCPYCGDSQKNKNKTRGYLYKYKNCLLYTSPSPRDMRRSRMPSSA